MPSLAPNRRTKKEYALFAVAWIGLGIAALFVRFLPFRFICRWMASPVRWTVPAISPDEAVVAVKRAAARAPWRAVCIQQGMVAHRLLRRGGYNSQFVYGISSATAQLRAHVWVRLDGNVVVGRETMTGFHEVVALPQ